MIALTFVVICAVAPVDGVDPRVYLKARKPVPHAIAELKKAPIDASLHILTDGPESFLADASAYPAHIDATARATLRVLERRALLIGAIHAVANKKPATAVRLLSSQLVARDALVRAEAADELGELTLLEGGASVVPALADTAMSDANARVREAACVGLAKVRTSAALVALTPFVLDESDAPRQRAAIRALAVLGSKWAWQARGDVAGGAAIRQEALALLARVGTAVPARAVADVEKALR
jgi:HEAT repeat protein